MWEHTDPDSGLLLQGRWEQKGVYVFYLELLTDMLHLVVYLVFFVIVFTNFGLPVHLVRPAAGQWQCLAVLQLVCVKWVYGPAARAMSGRICTHTRNRQRWGLHPGCSPTETQYVGAAALLVLRLIL